MESAQNLTDSPPDTSCQITKYQRVTDILNPLGPGVKVSFTILKFIGLWFLLYCNGCSPLHNEITYGYNRKTCIFKAAYVVTNKIALYIYFLDI